MDLRPLAFMGSRLLSVYLLVTGIYGAANAVATFQAFKFFGETPRHLALYAWTPATALAAALINLAACYVLWVHAGWVSKLLVPQSAAAAIAPPAWSSLAYRSIGLLTLINNAPTLIYYGEMSRRPDADATVKGQLIAYGIIIAVAVCLVVGADGFRNFVNTAASGPSEPDER